MKFRKFTIYGLISLMLLSFVGCENSNDTQEVQLGLSKQLQNGITMTTTSITTTQETTTTKKELTMQERLQNSKWGGCDGSGQIFSMQLTTNEIFTHTIDSMGYQKDVEGYWELDEDNEKILVYSDEDLSERLTYYDYIPIELENGDMILAMEGMYVSSIKNDDALSDIDETITSQFNTFTNTVVTGTYWIGEGETCVDFLTRNYSDMYIYIAEKYPDTNNDSEVTQFDSDDDYSYSYQDDEQQDETSQDYDGTSYFDGTWGLTYEYVYIDDTQNDNFIAFNWDYDAYTSTLRLTPLDDDFVEFTLSDALTLDDALDEVNSYLEEYTQEDTTTDIDEDNQETFETTDDYENPEETTLPWVVIETTVETTINYYTTYDINVDNPNYDDSTEYYDNYVPIITNSYALPITTTATTYNYFNDYNNYNNYNGYDNYNDYNNYNN